MTQTDKNYEELINSLAQYRENEDIYRYKLDQINQTRSKIQDQLLSLSKEYEKKVKDLQSKLDKALSHNEQLYRQNQLYKRDIEGFQNRLIEKQKLISVLVLQQNNVIAHSEKSKSENNQENFIDEEKGFKKQTKHKILSTYFQNQKNQEKESSYQQSYETSKKVHKSVTQQDVKIQSIQSQKEENQQPQIPVKRNVPPPPRFAKNKNMPKPKLSPNVQKNSQNIEQPVQQNLAKPEQENEQINETNDQVMSVIKKKIPTEEDEDKNIFFDNLNAQGTIKEAPKENTQMGAADFFSHLGSQPEDTNPMNEIQESSIDYADNSMMSSSTNMLDQNAQGQSKKMNKKKAKRERITTIDPNAFD